MRMRDYPGQLVVPRPDSLACPQLLIRASGVSPASMTPAGTFSRTLRAVTVAGRRWSSGHRPQQRRTWVASKQQPGTRYRGRRRLPKLPSRRYAAVVTTAFLGAVAVALTAGSVAPETAGIYGQVG